MTIGRRPHYLPFLLLRGKDGMGASRTPHRSLSRALSHAKMAPMKRLDVTADARDDGSHRVELSDGRYAFIKIRHDVPVDFFAAEARGLAALADTGTLRVPRVFAVGAHSIELEDLGSGHAGTGDWERAGRALASLHRLASDRFGFTADGYCGD